jgi:hypothetical protein
LVLEKECQRRVYGADGPFRPGSPPCAGYRPTDRTAAVSVEPVPIMQQQQRPDYSNQSFNGRALRHHLAGQQLVPQLRQHPSVRLVQSCVHRPAHRTPPGLSDMTSISAPGLRGRSWDLAHGARAGPAAPAGRVARPAQLRQQLTMSPSRSCDRRV